MKLVAVLSAALACAASANAQYFSEGWKPGQPVAPTEGAAAPAFTPGVQGQQGQASSTLDFSKFFTSGPIGNLLAKAGVNLSQSFNSSAILAELWDPRVPLIHDDNFDELIVNEELTPEEEKSRTWFLVISTSLGQQQQGGLSKLVDRQFDAAFNETVIADDLPNVRWGRIDYLNVTYITTKWNIWQGPWLVVARERGQSLRFYKGNQVRLNSTIIRTFLKDELWQHQEPWNSVWGPGGSREPIMHYWALGQRYIYDYTSRIPKFLLMIITGAMGSLIMRLLHRPPPEEKEKPKPAVARAPKAEPASTTPVGSPAKKTPSKSKKNGKK